MFKGCEKLTIVDLEGLQAMIYDSMEQMFYGCKNLTYLNIYNLDTKSNEFLGIDKIFEGIENKVRIVYNKAITHDSFEKID
jgi:surface protein